MLLAGTVFFILIMVIIFKLDTIAFDLRQIKHILKEQIKKPKL